MARHEIPKDQKKKSIYAKRSIRLSLNQRRSDLFFLINNLLHGRDARMKITEIHNITVMAHQVWPLYLELAKPQECLV